MLRHQAHLSERVRLIIPTVRPEGPTCRKVIWGTTSNAQVNI